MILTYILRRVIEKSKYPIFNICPMYFFSDLPNKFESIQEQVVENNFFTEFQKNIYMELFSESQKHYYAFSKLARIWKNSKLKFFDNDVDLCLKPLSLYPDSQKITLIHFKKKYVFRLTDLMNIWLGALTRNHGFSPAPRYPINPYINRPFRKDHLYSVYFKLLESTFLIPLLIQNFYQLNLNIAQFEMTNYPKLKDHAISNYLQSESDTTLFLDIIHMVETFKIELDHAYIDSRMPYLKIVEVVSTMKPFLKDFFMGSLSCNTLIREISRSAAVNGLRCFFIRYPLYGTLNYHDVPQPESDTEISDSEL